MTELTEAEKWIISAWSGIMFVILSSPAAFKLTKKLTDKAGWKTSEDGCPNWWGVVLHAVVFMVLVRLSMLIPFTKK